MAKKFAVLLVACLLLFFVNSVKASAFEIDKTATVLRVVDGDTFDLDSGERIRLADIDTPKVNEAGYLAAKNYVAGLIEGKTVYLNIDDISGADQYDRLVSVVYFEFNSTHFENLNKALLVDGYAVVYDFDNNEFNPSNWDLYESKATVPEFPAFVIVPLVFMATTLSLLWLKKKKGKDC